MSTLLATAEPGGTTEPIDPEIAAAYKLLTTMKEISHRRYLEQTGDPHFGPALQLILSLVFNQPPFAQRRKGEMDMFGISWRRILFDPKYVILGMDVALMSEDICSLHPLITDVLPKTRETRQDHAFLLRQFWAIKVSGVAAPIPLFPKCVVTGRFTACQEIPSVGMPLSTTSCDPGEEMPDFKRRIVVVATAMLSQTQPTLLHLLIVKPAKDAKDAK